VSQVVGKENLEKFETWRDGWIKEGWSAFKCVEYRGSLSRGKVSNASGVDLNALKVDKGNTAILTAFDELEKTLQLNLPNTFIVKKSALEQYHDYVEKLEQTGGRFPVDGDGELNVIRLAKNIGIPTARLNSPNIKKQLEDDVKRIGTQFVQGKTVEETMENDLTRTIFELSKCQKDLAIAEEKAVRLEEQNLKLERENRQLQKRAAEKDESLSYAIGSGRRFTL
jgi:hypothetical protein